MDAKIKNRIKKVKELCKNIRTDILRMSYKAKTAHLASSLSCVEIIATIFDLFLNIKKNYINNENRDRFILSKGHAASTLYSVLYRKKILSKNKLNSFCKSGSLLEEHPSPKIKGIECATGSLGHGMSIGCGMALGYKIKNNNSKVYVVISDGECNEGCVWESALFASAKKLSNLTVIIDYNKWQATERSEKVLSIYPLDKKFFHFGWEVIVLDGHNIKSLINALRKKTKNNKPKLILAHTIKGKGVKFMEDDNNWHYKSPNQHELNKAIVGINSI